MPACGCGRFTSGSIGSCCPRRVRLSSSTSWVTAHGACGCRSSAGTCRCASPPWIRFRPDRPRGSGVVPSRLAGTHRVRCRRSLRIGDRRGASRSCEAASTVVHVESDGAFRARTRACVGPWHGRVQQCGPPRSATLLAIGTTAAFGRLSVTPAAAVPAAAVADWSLEARAPTTRTRRRRASCSTSAPLARGREPLVVHRIDRDPSGVILFALNRRGR